MSIFGKDHYIKFSSKNAEVDEYYQECMNYTPDIMDQIKSVRES